MSSGDNLCKQIGPGSKLFDTLIIFLKEFFERVDFEKNQQKTKKREKLSQVAKSLYLCSGVSSSRCNRSVIVTFLSHSLVFICNL